MISNRLSTACLAAVMTLMAPASYGNDIVDFLRAVNRPRNVHNHYGGHHGGRYDRIHRVRNSRYYGRPFRPRRSVSIQIGHRPYRPNPVIIDPILEQAPLPSNFGPLPHEIGEFVTCNVPLATHVRVRNPHEIAPGAQPVVVAIRDPHLAAWGSHGCVEQLAYVQVFAPPCPLRRMTVSPCHTVVNLDYGDWEITLTSANGVIEVEYDD